MGWIFSLHAPLPPLFQFGLHSTVDSEFTEFHKLYESRTGGGVGEGGCSDLIEIRQLHSQSFLAIS